MGQEHNHYAIYVEHNGTFLWMSLCPQHRSDDVPLVNELEDVTCPKCLRAWRALMEA